MSSVSDFIAASMEGLRMQTSAHANAWGLGTSDRWDANLDAGTLVFSFADGRSATTTIQVIGTYDTLDGTFLWGWDHPSVPESLGEHARLAKAWGDEIGADAFRQATVQCTEDDAWGFAAVANRLGNGNGVYRGPAGTTLVFMTFGQVSVSKR